MIGRPVAAAGDVSAVTAVVGAEDPGGADVPAAGVDRLAGGADSPVTADAASVQGPASSTRPAGGSPARAP